MQYSVLARKWRPKSLQTVVGQDHIVAIIKNSIEKNRLHHAYLFCGSHGVGKTTFGRIFTKCLNCDLGPTATPCGQCNACQQIDQGNYPDLIEIDAASRTKVEDTRELLENIQYAPSVGKYKVYLIDEVHMLSGHSFNALLKTLEEPPSHVKFLLATTDPQKLPLTVLSRCLKLSLKILNITEITAHLITILKQENIAYETPALLEIAEAAKGSMRDALSLLDQAIAFCDETITFDKICYLLGTETKYLIFDLIAALADKNQQTLFSLVQTMEEKNADFMHALDDCLSLFYHIALYQKNTQLIPQEHAKLIEKLPLLSQQFSPEDIQLLYQIGLMAKKDLPFAPTARIGFEIFILRAMDFYPLENPPSSTQKTEIIPIEEAKTKLLRPLNEINPQTWPTILPQLNLKGITLTLANQARIGKTSDNKLELLLSERHRSLGNQNQQQILEAAIAHYVGHPVSVNFTFVEENKPMNQPESQQPKIYHPSFEEAECMDEPSRKDQNAERKSRVDAEEDSNFQQLLNLFNADIQKGP